MLSHKHLNGNGNGFHNGNGTPNHNGNGHNGHGSGNGLSSVPDETLLKRISRHQQPALKEFYGRHNRMLRNVVEGFVHESAEADDVLQEVFLQIWKEADHYSPKAGKPLGWVVTIARRRAIDRLRRRQAYCRARERYGDQLERQPQRPRREAEKVFVVADLRNFLKNRMRNLPKLQREAIELAFFKGLSHREISTATKSPLGTVKTRLELGLQKLTQAIKPLRNKV
jgi:RNA polymerase sigma-70 factor (ECF subfamily)